MENLPIPKNVLDVEFKLFGSLSVKQFLKVLAGCLVALGIFALQLPVILSLPAIVVSILTGICAALIPGFESKLMTFVKAIIVSPRYVWRKEENIPEVLSVEKQTGKSLAVPAKHMESGSQVDLGDVSLDMLLSAKPRRREEVVASEVNPNLDRVYNELYGGQTGGGAAQQPQPAVAVPGGHPLPVQSGPQPAAAQPPTDLAAVAQYEQELAGLKQRLAELNKQGLDSPEKASIMARIDELYSLAKGALPAPSSEKPELPSAPAVISNVYGFVVTKQNQPLYDVTAQLLDPSSQKVLGEGRSDEEGRIVISVSVPPGDYVMKLVSTNYRFDQFKVHLDTAKVPAFKFRAK